MVCKVLKVRDLKKYEFLGIFTGMERLTGRDAGWQGDQQMP